MAIMKKNRSTSSRVRILLVLSFFLGNNKYNTNCHAFTKTTRITNQRHGHRQTISSSSSFTTLKRQPQILKNDSRNPISLPMSSEIRPNNENNPNEDFGLVSSEDRTTNPSSSSSMNSDKLPSSLNQDEMTPQDSVVSSLWGFFFSNNNNNNQEQDSSATTSMYRKPPPLQIEDMNVLFYDVFLLLNLSASISFWVTHRMDIQYLSASISEGSLFCLLWIMAGLYNGAFLYSAVDGHYGSTSDKGGPRAAGMLGLHTFINTCSLRIISALGMALWEHRAVGSMPGEDLLPLEIAFGLMLMSVWRALHSSFTPRI